MDQDPYSKYVFYLKHDTGHLYKSIAEFCNLALPLTIFKLKNNSFSMNADNKTSKHDPTRMCSMHLPRLQFNEFRIPEELEEDDGAELLLPIESANMKKILSGVLKKDSIGIYLLKEDVSTLYFSIGNSERPNRKRVGIRLLDIGKLDDFIITPVELCHYDKNRPTAQGNASDFQDACKQGSVTKIDEIEIECYKTRIRMISKDVEIDGDHSFGDENDTQILCRGIFSVKQNISAVQKCCSIAKKVRLYYKPGKPLLISFCAGDYGTLDIYIVPNRETK